MGSRWNCSTISDSVGLATRSANDRPCLPSESVIASSVGASTVIATSGESRMSDRRAAGGVASINCCSFLKRASFWMNPSGVTQPAADDGTACLTGAAAAGAAADEFFSESEFLASGADALEEASMASRASEPLEWAAAGAGAEAVCARAAGGEEG